MRRLKCRLLYQLRHLLGKWLAREQARCPHAHKSEFRKVSNEWWVENSTRCDDCLDVLGVCMMPRYFDADV